VRLARQLIEHQLAVEGVRLLADPALNYWQQTSDVIGGDLLLAARSPSGALHVLFANAGTRGISAYLSLQPVVAPFQRMTERGFTLAAIVRELNAKVCQMLPAGHVLTAQMVVVDSREGVLSLWNGGMPPAFVLDADGHHFHEFTLVHAPLGTLDDAEFSDRIEMHALGCGDQLVMASAGLLEAIGPAGTRFGEQGLADALVGLPRSQRRDRLVTALQTHLGAVAAIADMTLALVDCDVAAVDVVPPDAAPPEPAAAPGDWGFTLRLTATEFRHVDVVPLLLGVVEQFPAARPCSGELFVILSELFNNALDHGLLRLDSRIKHSPEGLETWLLLREERLAALQEGEIHLCVEQVIDRNQTCLRIRCSDSGNGFDLAETLERNRARLAGNHPCSLPSGRGLTLVASLAQVIETGPRGNEITVLLPLDGKTVATH
jgi:anti-sigma regulatory factor (Ser/Thr protein kinase)